MMLSVILISMLMILLSTPGVIGHLICGNSRNCLLLRDTEDWVRNWLVDFNASKAKLVRLTGLITLVLLI